MALNLYPLIEDKLYQSGLPGEIVSYFDRLEPTVVVDCTHDIPFFGVFSPLFIKLPFDDKPLPLENKEGASLIMRLSQVARFLALLIRSNEKILVHCNAGENRSSLLDGIVLLELRSMGLITFKSVVDFIQSKRPGALQNQSFVAFLNGQCGIS